MIPLHTSKNIPLPRAASVPATRVSQEMTREDAIAILDEYIKNSNLRKHMLAVEAVMRAYAAQLNGDADEWGIVGLLHDFDYEIHPTVTDHPMKGEPILRGRGVPDHIRRAVLAHAKHSGVIPRTPMEKAVFACDELTGFIIAVALVMPNKKLAEVTIDTIEKKLKQRSFAAKVNREEIEEGINLLGVSREQHFRTVLTALQAIHEELGL